MLGTSKPLSRAMLMAATLHGCSGRGEPSPPSGFDPAGESPAAPRFAMHFFAERVAWSYTYEPLWAAVRGRDPAAATASFSDADVIAYEVGPRPAACIVLRLTDGAAARLRAALAGLRETPVLVTLDGAPLYAALEYLSYGAAALRLPVVHLALERGAIQVCAVQGAAVGVAADEPAIRRIDRAELRALFTARGLLRETDRPAP